MTNHQILPSEQPQAGTSNIVALASIAGVCIAALLAAVIALLWISGIAAAAWAMFGVGVWFGLSATISAILIAGPLH